MTVNAVKEWIYENKEMLIKHIQELVRIPSISGNELKVQEHIFKLLQQIGLNPKIIHPQIDELRKDPDFFETTSFVKYGYENRPNIAAEMKGLGGGRSICLSGHIDVVSPEPLEKWNYNPWGGEVEGDWIYGRGAGDMKAGVAANIITLEAIKATETPLKGDLYFETTIEEEDGGVGGNLWMRLTQPKTDAAIIPEPSALQLGIASAGVMYFRVKVEGAPAHAATAHFGINAIHKMMPIIESLRKLNKERQAQIRYPYAEDSDPRMKGHSTTINLGTIKAGDWPSTVPGTCTIECRIGWPPIEQLGDVKNQIETTVREAANKDEWLSEYPPKVEWFGWRARPHEQDVNHPFVKLMKDKITEVTGEVPMYYGGSAGLDTRFFVHHGIPAVTFGPLAERIHSFDERVSIESAMKVAETIAKTVIDWCEIENPS